MSGTPEPDPLAGLTSRPTTGSSSHPTRKARTSRRGRPLAAVHRWQPRGCHGWEGITMTVTPDAPATVQAGASDEELALMREAAARVAALAPAATDPFGVLAEPFFPQPLGGPGRWHREDGHHWCVDQ